jgi:predicted GIY-YIG superfamily endonuclease
MTIPVTAHVFDDATLNKVNEVGGVYCLLQQAGPAYFNILYVGLSDNSRRRLREHYNNPPIRGITHFHLEVVPNALLREAREKALIREFNPPGNVHHTR